MKYEAKKVRTFYDDYENEVVYEYRGKEYSVYFSRAENFFSRGSAKMQHEEAQRKIDNELDNPKPTSKELGNPEEDIFAIMDWLDQTFSD